LLALVGAIAALITVALGCRARSRGAIAAAVVFTLIFLSPSFIVITAFFPELIDGRFRTYKNFYKHIEVGMTRNEVLALRDHYYPKTGSRLPPKVMEDTEQRLGFFMNPETQKEPNCEGIFLSLDHGRVTNKVYSAD
jgi:hypothetical protein